MVETLFWWLSTTRAPTQPPTHPPAHIAAGTAYIYPSVTHKKQKTKRNGVHAPLRTCKNKKTVGNLVREDFRGPYLILRKIMRTWPRVARTAVVVDLPTAPWGTPQHFALAK